MRIPRRNGVAQAALGRKPTAMAHRLEPRGGARNDQADILNEEDDVQCDYQPTDPRNHPCTLPAGHVGKHLNVMGEELLGRALRNLRHLYEQMIDGVVKNQQEAARGLLGPAIELIEKCQ